MMAPNKGRRELSALLLCVHLFARLNAPFDGLLDPCPIYQSNQHEPSVIQDTLATPQRFSSDHNPASDVDTTNNSIK